MAMGCISGSSLMKTVVPALIISNDRCCVQKLHGFETRTVVSKGSRKRAIIQAAAKSGSVDHGPTSTNTSSGPAQSHLALLERMTENSTASQGDEAMTIRDQLASQIEPEASEVVVPLGKEGTKTPQFVAAELTISQKRNIRRQNYLNKASERNDTPFFAAVAGLVLVPPILILAFAIATGYVEFFP